MTEKQQLLVNAVDAVRADILAAERWLWEHPQTGYTEWQAHEYMKEKFEALGYTLTFAGDIPGFITDVDTGLPGPKVVMCKDLNYPEIRGATTGELMSSVYKNLGCVGVVTDGAVRDVDESNASGFKLLATRLMVGHGYACPVRWGHDIELLGTTVRTGDLVHIDKYGFICLDEEEQVNILEAARRLDGNECQSVISTMYGSVQNEAFLKANIEAVKAQLDKQAALNDAVRRDLSPKYVHGAASAPVL